MITLTQQERDKFATYLEQDAASDNAMAEQVKQLGPHSEGLAKKLRAEAMAATIIAAKLRSIEDLTIG